MSDLMLRTRRAAKQRVTDLQRRLAVLLAVTLAACSAAPGRPVSPAQDRVLPAGSCSLDLPSDNTNEDVIAAVLKAEGELVVRQDIQTLMRLWNQDGEVIDARHTPENPEDDQAWRGKDAIRHRYVQRVFPGAPGLIKPAILVVSIDGDRAVVTATTRIDAEISPAGDRWELVRQEGCWLLQRLTFNMEPPSP